MPQMPPFLPPSYGITETVFLFRKELYTAISRRRFAEPEWISNGIFLFFENNAFRDEIEFCPLTDLNIQRPILKSALRPPPSARAESTNFRPFYVKRADFSPPPPATKKRRKLVKTRPRCPHLATKKSLAVGGGWGDGSPPSFSLIWLPLSDLGTKLVT